MFVCSLAVTDEVKSVSVMEGDSVSLNTGVTETQKYLLIQWMFGSTRIAEVNRLTQTNSTYDGPDGRYRDRLKLDQTGSLTITNTRTTDSGLYQLAIVNRETRYINYNVTVYGMVLIISLLSYLFNCSFLFSKCPKHTLYDIDCFNYKIIHFQKDHQAQIVCLPAMQCTVHP